jgi:hypothetical protein
MLIIYSRNFAKLCIVRLFRKIYVLFIGNNVLFHNTMSKFTLLSTIYLHYLYSSQNISKKKNGVLQLLNGSGFDSQNLEGDFTNMTAASHMWYFNQQQKVQK